MINKILQKEIISHIVKLFGVFNEYKINIVENLIDNKFLLEKKLAFELDDGTKYQSQIWSACMKVENSQLNVMIADIKDNIAEFALIIQMDTFPAYALRLSGDTEDFGDICVNIDDNKWIDVNTAMQAKFLSGIEGLTEILVEWKKTNNYEDLYKLLVGFLNGK